MTLEQTGRLSAPGVRVRMQWLDAAYLLALCVLGGVIWGAFARHFPFPASNPDAQDTAQIARQVFLGRGMHTRFMPLNGLEFLLQQGFTGQEWPNITRFPLIVLIQTALFYVVSGDQVIVLSSTLFYFLTLPLVYTFGALLSGRLVGCLAGILYVATVPLVRASFLGLGEPASGFLLILICVLLATRLSLPRAALAGAAFGLTVLSRYNFLLFALPIGLYLVTLPSGWRKAVPFGVAALLVVVPWLIYLSSITPEPFFNIQAASTVRYELQPGEHVLGWYRTDYISPVAVLMEHPDQMLAKFVREAGKMLPSLPGDLRPFAWMLVPTYAIAFWRRRQAAVSWRLLNVVIGSIVLQFMLVNSLGYNFSRHYLFFVPVLLVWIVDAVVWSARATIRHTLLAPVVAVIGLALVFNATWRPHYPSVGKIYADTKPENQALLRTLPPDTVVASNMPWTVAWNSDRRTIPIPPRVEDIPTIEQRYSLKIGAIYLIPPGYLYDSPPEWLDSWEPIRQTCGPIPGFQQPDRLDDGVCLYVHEAERP